MTSKKILPVLTTISLLSSTCVGLINVSAAPTETEPFSVEYVETKDNTKKQINIYYTGKIVDLGTIGFSIFTVSDIETISAADMTLGTATASAWDSKDVDTYNMAKGKITFSGIVTLDPVYTADNLLGTIVLTVPEDTETFNMTIDIDQSYVFGGDYEEYKCSTPITLSIPKYTTGGGDEPTGDTITATPGDTFKNYADPLVKIFTADITGKDISDKDVKWILTRTDGKHYTTDAIINTEVTGGLDFVLGLKIQSRDESRITDVTKAELSIKAKTVE